MISESEYRYTRWKKAVKKSMGWEISEPQGNSELSFMHYL